MDCGACAAKVDAAVRRLPGVEDVSVSATAGTMTVYHQSNTILLPAMKAQLKGLRLAMPKPARIFTHARPRSHGGRVERAG
jgi:Cd2+/Zn2+-exporting ATPase